MQRHWNDHELETYWSFSSDELKLIPHRDACSRLGVAASLKFFQLEGYFPSSGRDIPSAALDYMAKHDGVRFWNGDQIYRWFISQRPRPDFVPEA